MLFSFSRPPSYIFENIHNTESNEWSCITLPSIIPIVDSNTLMDIEGEFV